MEIEKPLHIQSAKDLFFPPCFRFTWILMKKWIHLGIFIKEIDKLDSSNELFVSKLELLVAKHGLPYIPRYVSTISIEDNSFYRDQINGRVWNIDDVRSYRKRCWNRMRGI